MCKRRVRGIFFFLLERKRKELMEEIVGGREGIKEWRLSLWFWEEEGRWREEEEEGRRSKGLEAVTLCENLKEELKVYSRKVVKKS